MKTDQQMDRDKVIRIREALENSGDLRLERFSRESTDEQLLRMQALVTEKVRPLGELIDG